MSLNKISVSLTERVAPSKGPTSSADYNASMEEIRNSLAQISVAWNTKLQPLIDTLPGGSTGVNRDERTTSPNPFKNGFDGSQIYTDATSTVLTDDGAFYTVTEKRPLTIKETFSSLKNQVNRDLEKLEIKIAQINRDNLLSARQKQLIGSRIFDLGSTSSANSLDGLLQENGKSVTQMALDMYGTTDALTGSGTKTLLFDILHQLKAIQNAHRYNSSTDTMDHRHLKFYERRYHVLPDGAIDGVNVNYKLPFIQDSTTEREQFVTGSLRVVINGVEQKKNFIYTEDSDNAGFTLLRTPLEADGQGADDILWVHYDIDTTGER